jgi:transposase
MAKYKPYDYAQTVLVAVSLEEQLMPGTLEFAIHTLVETRMDMSIFEGNYKNDETGRAAYDPKVLLKVVLLAYARGMVSSRKIEKACQENVTFMALLCGQKPDHSTIAAFVSSMKDEILPLFRDILLVCDQEDLLGGTVFALDGCRLPSNASKEWSGTIADLKRKKEKIEKKVMGLLEEQQEADTRGGDASRQGSLGDTGGRQRQIERLKRKAARIQKWLHEHEAKIGDKGKEVQSNITDSDSAKMITTHGTIQGYSGQILVDGKHQIVVHGDAFGKGQDSRHLEPMLDGAKETMERIGHSAEYFRGTRLTADADYHSSSSVAKCIDEGVDAYIPDKLYRRRDPRLKPKRFLLQRENKYRLEEFRYDTARDQYVCPGSKMIRLKAHKVRTAGNLYRIYAANQEDCDCCQLRHRCVAEGKGRRKHLSVPIGTDGIHLSKQMAAKIESEQGRRLYPERMKIVEPVFANLRIHKGLDRFTLRGKVKVTIQWLLYCMVHNIEKILHYGHAYAQ